MIVQIGPQSREIGRTGAGFDHDFPVDDRGIDGECLQGIGYVRAEFTGPVETPCGSTGQVSSATRRYPFQLARDATRSSLSPYYLVSAMARRKASQRSGNAG
ncbi:hypothetical protein [Acidiphilium acidophilum]|uniref:hypothetical protein n=1 Tax=Acidiphilium acidophilum TaxID=76588 RepID=UPI002E8E7507|nr:hypothetical protein [Acidiphilium acidophilum]